MVVDSIKWQPTHHTDTVVPHKTHPHAAWKALYKVFGTLDSDSCIILERDDAPRLEAMHAVTEHSQSIYSELAVLVATYGQIEIKATRVDLEF